MRKGFILIFGLLAVTMLKAQLPVSNIYVFDLQRDTEKDSLFLAKPKFLTNFNRTGYNNHPHFLNKEELMFSSSTAFQNQPDLYTLNVDSKVRTKITDTPAGEYSPRRMPDYFNFSAVRMEYLPNDTLIRLWQFPMDRSSNGRPVFQDQTNVGYYAWLNSRDIVLYKVQVPNQLVKSDIYSGTEEVIAQNVGRCFIPAGGGTLLYVQKNDGGNADIMSYDSRAYFDDQKKRKIAPTLSGAEDFAVTMGGTVIMAYDSKLYTFELGQDEEWQLLADLSAYGIKGISRLALSPNDSRIALVAQ
jgi:hypothetical protein